AARQAVVHAFTNFRIGFGRVVLIRKDDARHPLIAIVDQELASSVFETLDVIGQRIHNGFEQTLEIVGVVGHVTHGGLDIDAIAASLDRRRFSLVVLGMFAVTALLLSAIGIYGVVSYGVSRRTRDIGIRLALGASRRDILSEVLGEGGRLALIGTVLGLVASI